MKYVSTRGLAPKLGFNDVLLAGLARDGGLYVPETWPRFSKSDIRDLRGLAYAEIAARVMAPFVGRAIRRDDLTSMVVDAYRDFDHPAVAPLRQIGRDQWLMELTRGPTLAFKDYALQLLGRLFEHVLRERGQRIVIVGATSGDTGSAAIEACRDRKGIEIFMLHPKGRVSEVQRRQMTTVLSKNVHNIAVDGTFDDCQDLVKAMFNDLKFRDRHRLSAVNSINWARIMAQVAYYFAGAVALGAPDRRLTFAVPTGNFGNVYAAYASKRMGLPIERLVIGSNANDILTRYFETGTMSLAEVVPTLSPSMDIQISSNFERLLFEVCGRKGPAVAKALGTLRRDGTVDFGHARWQSLARLFAAHRLDDAETKAVIAGMHKLTGELLDPHTAIGVAAGIRHHDYKSSAMIALATAHPAKFPDAVEAATGIRPALPPRLADLFEREERCQALPSDADALKDCIDGRMGKRNAA